MSAYTRVYIYIYKYIYIYIYICKYALLELEAILTR